MDKDFYIAAGALTVALGLLAYLFVKSGDFPHSKKKLNRLERERQKYRELMQEYDIKSDDIEEALQKITSLSELININYRMEIALNRFRWINKKVKI